MFHVGFSFAQAALSVCIESPPEKEKESGTARPIHVRHSRVRLISYYGEPLDQEAFSCCHFVRFPFLFLLVILGAYPAALGSDQWWHQKKQRYLKTAGNAFSSSTHGFVCRNRFWPYANALQSFFLSKFIDLWRKCVVTTKALGLPWLSYCWQ